MTEAKIFITKVRESVAPMDIQKIQKFLLKFRRWDVEGWHAKRRFTIEAKKELKNYIQSNFIS